MVLVATGLGLNPAESCWGSAVSGSATSTELFRNIIALQSSSFKGDGFGRFGLESCWGSAVSQPRSTELLSDKGGLPRSCFPRSWGFFL